MARTRTIPRSDYSGGPTRREFLQLAAASGAYLIAGLGCGDDPNPDEPALTACTPDFDGGEFLALEPFANDRDVPLNRPFGSGLGGGQLYDLRELNENNLVTPNDLFYIRTRYPDLLDPNREWTLRIHGRVQSERVLTLDELLPASVDQGVRLLECSGNGAGPFGLLSAAQWGGIPVHDVLDRVNPTAGATRVLISGFDEHSRPSEGSVPGASWVFTREQLAESFFAVEMNGEPLPEDHGKPVRLFNPGWYGCTCIKWVDEIRFVGEDEPATSQMQEFAARTHQDGTPELARDYIPALIDTTAMPVRIERWRVGGAITYRIMGIVWGGDQVAPPLSIGIGLEGGEQSFEPISLCPARAQARTWGLWWHRWTPRQRGLYAINLRVDDPAVRTRRLDSGWYTRTVDITSI